jgi:hypothetical protein
VSGRHQPRRMMVQVERLMLREHRVKIEVEAVIASAD